MNAPSAEFEREHGFAESEWLRCLPGAVAPHALSVLSPNAARVALAGGDLVWTWRVLPMRRIALMSLPRLAVHYRFDAGVAPAAREDFMQRFDRYMQRGGG